MPPLSIMIKPVSASCGLRCRYCFYADVSGHREVKNYGFMTRETLETLVRRAFAYADGGISFAFQGGEPLLAGLGFYRDFVSFVRKYNTRGLSVGKAVQTNGIELTEEMAAFFAENGFLVGLSLDGTREIHDRYRVDAAGNGTYDRVKRAQEMLEAAGCEYNLLTVVSADIASQPDAVFDAMSRHPYLQFIPLIDGFDGEKGEYSLTPEAYGRFLIRLFDHYEKAWRAGKPVSIRTFDNYLQMLMGGPAEDCGMAGVCGAYYLIEADGGVYPCDFYVLDEWRTGNINTDSFRTLAASERARVFREMSLKKPRECLTCRWAGLCRGGCRRDREPFVDGCFSRSRFCESYRMFFEACCGRMRKMAQSLRGGN